ncbi:hypothetical protein HOLleu_18042 [Holothuria leucospilota]|uniref:Uncharacterized protein n=1 Tax=Holothuria leucospilota TaxID=206669 RepID=A0A9Q1C311_HOLLE|nr:hypothetical protein HOLleu_18042 [Holothuria leucospilota]
MEPTAFVLGAQHKQWSRKNKPVSHNWRKAMVMGVRRKKFREGQKFLQKFFRGEKAPRKHGLARSTKKFWPPKPTTSLEMALLKSIYCI